jgi:hypothetical protein
MKNYPIRFVCKPVRTEPEEPGRFMRVCPGCLRPLAWRHHLKLLRLDDPKPSNDLGEIVWAPDLQRYVVPRYRDESVALCSMHREVDWWLIFDFEKQGVVGIASDHPDFWPEVMDEEGKVEPQGGRLFDSPIPVERLAFIGWARRWRIEQRNKGKKVPVQTGRQRQMTLPCMN